MSLLTRSITDKSLSVLSSLLESSEDVKCFVHTGDIPEHWLLEISEKWRLQIAVFAEFNPTELTQITLDTYFKQSESLETVSISESFKGKEHAKLNFFKPISQLLCLKNLTFRAPAPDNYNEMTELFMEHLNAAEFKHRLANLNLSGRAVKVVPQSLQMRLDHLNLVNTSISLADIQAFILRSDVKKVSIKCMEHITSKDAEELKGLREGLEIFYVPVS